MYGLFVGGVMKGPYSVNDISLYVEPNSIGAYILSSDGKHVYYVGRSDNDLQRRIRQSASERSDYTHFWVEYTTSPMRAYLLECKWFHKYRPTDNSVHPAVPPGMNWRCPVAGCEWF